MGVVSEVCVLFFVGLYLSVDLTSLFFYILVFSFPASLAPYETYDHVFSSRRGDGEEQEEKKDAN